MCSHLAVAIWHVNYALHLHIRVCIVPVGGGGGQCAGNGALGHWGVGVWGGGGKVEGEGVGSINIHACLMHNTCCEAGNTRPLFVCGMLLNEIGEGWAGLNTLADT